jgi:hypothetical protein
LEALLAAQRDNTSDGDDEVEEMAQEARVSFGGAPLSSRNAPPEPTRRPPEPGTSIRSTLGPPWKARPEAAARPPRRHHQRARTMDWRHPMATAGFSKNCASCKKASKNTSSSFARRLTCKPKP